FDLLVDEDTLNDTERSHTTEQIAYVVFGQSVTTPPTIDAAFASPSTIMEGGSALLEWETTGASSVSIDQGVGAVSLDGTVSVSPATTTTYTITATGPAGSVDAQVTVTVTPAPSITFERGIVTNLSTDSWTTVNLTNTYSSMVVVCTPNHDVNTQPVAVRIRNAGGSSFEVSLSNASGLVSSISGVSAHYFVIEEGVYTLATHGVAMEAVKYTSTVTDRKNSWNGEARSYQQAYSQPVVLGQVMTANDPNFSVFWSRGSARTNPPSATELWVGKQVAEDTTTTRADETVGYVVIEAGSGQIGTVPFVAGVGADSISGVGNSPPYAYSFSGLSSPSVAVVSVAAIDGGNGGWPILYGATPLSATQIQLAFDEDTIADTERAHTNEQAAYIVFD
ncbi:MAG: hypothetical protein AAF517_23110, partial [Planctomycetota bacterium]